MKTAFNIYYLPLALFSVPLLPATICHAAGETTRISISPTGEETKTDSYDASISADGRYVAFYSGASSLVAGDTNGNNDVFVRDRQTGKTTRVSVKSNGEQGNGISICPSISADGRYVAFLSIADNLVPGDTNETWDVFVHDRTTRVTTRVSVNSAGQQGNSDSKSPSSNVSPSISVDGRYVAFWSFASNLVPGDFDGRGDVFVHDRNTGTTTRVSVNSESEEIYNGAISAETSLSANGRYVAFSSSASSLVPGDTNKNWDVFVHDRTTHSTSRVSVTSNGEQINGGYGAAINADGRYVAYSTSAVFVHDRKTGEKIPVSVDQTGVPRSASVLSISADGRYVTFRSNDPNMLPGADYLRFNNYVRDLQKNTTFYVAGKNTSDGFDPLPLSADGRFLAFSSRAGDLVPGDTNDTSDIFVRDRWLNPSQSADLQVAVISQPASVQNGDVGRYLFTITNNGPDDAESVTLTNTVSAGKVWSLTPSKGECSEAAVNVCRLHTLAAGESVTVRTVFKAKGNPLIQNLTVNAAPVDSNPDNNRVTVSTPVTP